MSGAPHLVAGKTGQSPFPRARAFDQNRIQRSHTTEHRLPRFHDREMPGRGYAANMMEK